MKELINKQEKKVGSIKGIHNAIRQCYAHKIYECIEFNTFLKNINILPNIKGSDPNGLGKPSQIPFPDCKEDLWNIWNYFGEKQATEIIKELNQRKILKTFEGLEIILNLNSYEFYRDTNFSISIYDGNIGKEIAIVGFKILENKSIEIFQIQGKGKYGVNECHFHLLLDECREFLGKLGFKKIFIIKAEKLFYFRTPIMIPDSIVDIDDFIKRNKDMMAITYNANPIRKWGFKKPLNKENRKFYSAEANM